MPPTRREQLELDELLSDIYRGIETLPDNNKQVAPGIFTSHTYTREYELPASSPLVKQHKQELAALRNSSPATSNSNQQPHQQATTSSKLPQRSTLKRNTTPQQQQQQQPQSLASFVTSSTPDNKRRVRIVDHPNKVAREHSVDEGGKKPNVKYVNTNKLIYHQENNPDDDDDDYHESAGSVDENRRSSSKQANCDDNDDDDDDIDGVTRVEYYHTTWLDRQLGRASKRRSSKELNERQVKEKAMIEELKRSLKNGAITLRQSFKGKRNSNKSKPSETYDDQMLDSSNRVKKNSVFGSGLATIPRNYHHHQSSAFADSNNNNNSNSKKHQHHSKKPQPLSNNNKLTESANHHHNTLGSPRPTPDYREASANHQSTKYQQEQQQQQQPQANYSRTLPHNYQAKHQGAHQLLQSHYRGDKSFDTNHANTLAPRTSDTMRNVNYSTMQPQCTTNNNGNYQHGNSQVKSPVGNYYQPQQQQPNQQTENTISSIPSASEVVRSALSRSNSQISLNQLNKTINLLPNSPPPYGNPSPMTPTQQLRAATPSLSPSPTCGSPMQQHHHHQQQPQQQTNQRQQTQYPNQAPYSQTQASPYASKTWNSSTPDKQQPQPQQQQQQVYANPHASFMQHKLEQQTTKPSGRNTASIREFNELDSLLRSLSPASTTTTHITPGYTSRPAQPSFGFGPAVPQQQQQQQQRPSADIYAKVQKQPTQVTNHQYPASGVQQNQQQQQQYAPATISAANQNYTIDVSDKKDDDDCTRRPQLSEFEPPCELLPSMEDYQNITKLNPVKNHYWYKPNMSRDRAISLLKDKPQGTFIVRDSTSFRGAYGLAVKVSKLPKNVLNNVNLRNPNADPSSELIRHFLIEPTTSGVRLKGYANEPVFGSLPSLIYQHSLTELALPCKLVIPRADIEDPRFNQKQKQFYEEFLASKEQFKHSPYERTSPNGGYRKYPGDVYIHNEHRIIFE